MTQFAIFYHADLAGKLAPLMGSDQYCPIDGRFSLTRARHAAMEQAKRLKGVKPGILGYQIRRGTIRNSHPVGIMLPVSMEAAPEFYDAKAKGIAAW